VQEYVNFRMKELVDRGSVLVGVAGEPGRRSLVTLSFVRH
jgi:hypothetical protein